MSAGQLMGSVQAERDGMHITVTVAFSSADAATGWQAAAEAVAVVACLLHWADRVALTQRRALLEHALQLTDSAGLGPAHHLRLLGLRLALDTAVDCGDFGAAAQAGGDLAAASRRSGVPPVWPPLGVQLAVAAKCAVAADLPKLCRQLGQQAIGTLAVSHRGTDVLAEAQRCVAESELALAAAASRMY